MIKSEQARELILRAAKDPVVDNMGYANMRQTFRKYGINKSVGNTALFREMIPKEIKNLKLGGQAISSMPFGPKALALGWQALKEPCVYAVVCKYTGNAYIGSSLTPWLRRAVHLYWLKNYYRYGASNIFFGSKKIAKDIQHHGVESFYFEVVQHMPGATSKEIRAAETAFLKLHGLSKCYNRWDIEEPHRASHVFFEVEPSFKELDMQVEAAFIDFKACRVSHHEYMLVKTEKRAVLLEKRRNKEITPKEYQLQYRKMSEEHRDKKRLLYKLYADYKVLKAKAKRELAALKKRYSEATEPGY